MPTSSNKPQGDMLQLLELIAFQTIFHDPTIIENFLDNNQVDISSDNFIAIRLANRSNLKTTMRLLIEHTNKQRREIVDLDITGLPLVSEVLSDIEADNREKSRSNCLCFYFDKSKSNFTLSENIDSNKKSRLCLGQPTPCSFF